MRKLTILLLILCMLFVPTSCKGISNGIPGVDTDKIENIINDIDVQNIIDQIAGKDTTEVSPYTDGLHINLYDHSFIIPEYNGKPVYIVNDNKPLFKQDEIIDKYYESYSGLDDLGRCQVAMACLSKETMPAEGEKRESISSVKPAGWHTAKYPELIKDNYLYNRCHLIGWQLSAENANELNLTTGTRYLNVDGMLPYEDMVDDYIEKNQDNHVMYRVTPVFMGNELVCRGILMEAQSVEDNGCIYCVWCYNVQPGIDIDYLTGESKVSTSSPAPTIVVSDDTNKTYVLNTKTKKVHTTSCSDVKNIAEKNIDYSTESLESLLKQGYTTCKKCNP